MTRLLVLVLAICTVATPALAARMVYLKDGGVIRAKSVWRTGGMVHVLVNRDTLTEFSPAEIDMKRTFAPKRQKIRKPAAAVQKTESAGAEAAAAEKRAENRPESSLPSRPTLTEKNPEDLVPSSGAGGTIRKQKKDMAEKLGE